MRCLVCDEGFEPRKGGHAQKYCTPECRRVDERKARVAAQRKINYGIDRETYEHMGDEQEWRCAICDEHETRMRGGVRMSLCVDHNHDTGEVRRLLCTRCNSTLGYMKEDPELLRRAAEYLEKFV